MALTRLKQLREEAVLTVHELAKASGVSDDTISKIENGQRVARPNTLRKLARALDVSPQELRRPAKREEPALAEKAEAPREAGHTPTRPGTPLSDSINAEEFEARFSEADTEERAHNLRLEVDAEFVALQKYIRELKDRGYEDGSFVVQRARADLKTSRQRLAAITWKATDFSLGRTPRKTAADYYQVPEELEQYNRENQEAEARKTRGEAG